MHDLEYELAFEEAGRAPDAQERTVNELRARAGVLIAAATRIHRDLALHRSASYERNGAHLRVLVRAFQLGLVLLVVEVAAWLIAVSERSSYRSMPKKPTPPASPRPQPERPSPMQGEFGDRRGTASK
jgi:hypothetical protein